MSDKQKYSLLNLLLAAWFMQQCIDNLRGTTYDTRQLKARMNQLEPELKKIIDRDLDLLWGADSEAMYNLQDGMTKFFALFAEQRVENIAGFAELVERFIAMPTWCMNMLGVKIV